MEDDQAFFCDVPVLSVPMQSSSDYISPYELPLVAQTPTDKAEKESEVPLAGNEAYGRDSVFRIYVTFVVSLSAKVRSCICSLTFPAPLEEASSEPTQPVDTNDLSSQPPPETNAEEAKQEAENTTETPQPAAEPPQTPDTAPVEDPAPDAGTPETLTEASPSLEEAAPEKEAAPEPEAAPEMKEEPVNDSSTNPEPASDDKPGTEEAPGEPDVVVVPSPASAGPDGSTKSLTSSEGNMKYFIYCTHHSFSSVHTPKVKVPEKENRGQFRDYFLLNRFNMTAYPLQTQAEELSQQSPVCLCRRAFNCVYRRTDTAEELSEGHQASGERDERSRKEVSEKGRGPDSEIL